MVTIRKLGFVAGGLFGWIVAYAAPPTDQPALAIDMRVPEAPQWIDARDGRHALYELHLANFRARPLKLQRIEVRDTVENQPIAEFTGEALTSILVRPGTPQLPDPLELTAGTTAVAFIELKLPRAARPPHVLTQVLDFAEAADGSEPAYRVTSEPLTVGDEHLVLSTPMRGTGWLAANGLGNTSGHRRALLPVNAAARIAQRYAIDWVQIGENGRVARDDSKTNASFFCYGAPVLAVADGVVTTVKDGIPENMPLSDQLAVKITVETITGNYVLLDIGGGAWVVYGHLQPGSLKVKRGDRVTRGQELGLIGNSGNSDAPHLHIHVSDRPAGIAAEGLPFAFEKFSWRGHVDNLESMIETSTMWQATANDARERELPLDGDVVDF